jgi:hypothetical protein
MNVIMSLMLKRIPGYKALFWLVGILMPWFFTNQVLAHEYENHGGTSDPTKWLIGGISAIAVIVVISIWGRLTYSGIRRQNTKEIIRSVTVLTSFFLWFALVGTQHWVLSREANPVIYAVSIGLGYFVLPYALISLWSVVLLHAGGHLRSILKVRRYRLVFIAATIAYGLFYLFASGLFAPPDPEDPPLPYYGFIHWYESYGPLTFWPNVEFWWPAIQIFGALSVGTFLMLVTIAGFMGISIVLLIYGWRLRANKKLRVQAVGSTTGSSLAIAATSFCCCCLPVLYPILVLLVGSTAAESLALLLVNSSGPLFNLIQMAILSLMAVTAIFAANRLNAGDQTNSGKVL